MTSIGATLERRKRHTSTYNNISPQKFLWQSFMKTEIFQKTFLSSNRQSTKWLIMRGVGCLLNQLVVCTEYQSSVIRHVMLCPYLMTSHHQWASPFSVNAWRLNRRQQCRKQQWLEAHDWFKNSKRRENNRFRVKKECFQLQYKAFAVQYFFLMLYYVCFISYISFYHKVPMIS